MSIFDYLFDSDWHQRSDINALRDQSDVLARKLRREKRALEGRVEELEGEVAGLSLFVRSLLSTLLASGAIRQEDFARTMRELDLEDGVEDGR